MKLNINMNERMEHYNVTGLSIALIHNGLISMTEGFGVLETGTNNKVNRNSIFSACSISKFLTSILVLKLAEQGIVDLDEDLNNKLTSWKIPDHEFTQSKKVTLRTLLSHQSGVIEPDGSFSELDSTQGIPSMVDLLEGRTSYCKEPIKMMYEPGSDFHYSDAGFCIIQQLIEDVFEKPFEVVMNELVFEPLNMKNSTIIQSIPTAMSEQFSCGHHKNGSLVDGKYPICPYPAASGLWTTPSDLAVLMIELINSLKSKSKLGLSVNKMKELITSQGCKEWTGLGVFLDGSQHELKISSLGWGVGFQCMMVAYPYLEKGAVIMTNTDLGVHQLKGIIGEIFNSLTL
ncbi:CubicO group peptidase, beta-lactamase class C family [Paenibacillus uliginis N3/975]|uniref:CubicO group peptidase, beta-lactamase class C family n=1 Tax=Paenibacillus uliginis N3/975 TaxID=1313296 RepID=A0A1X7HQE3_9BACL|nr:serine hydrolase domain-containing protein [Paenibacillus uliginis]SMF90872.1 CubicO group peptidase, beta-lactamase class C family [Paenibacillus uliginis N3/975]